MNDPVTQVDVVLVVVLCVVVGHEDVDVEAHQVDLANADPLGGVPVPVQKLES